MGYQIIAIGADRPAKQRQSIQRHLITYTVLSDSSMTAARAFGLAFRVDDTLFQQYKEHGIDLEEASGMKHHILPVPAVFLVDTEGVIQFEYVNPNHRVRLHPDILRAAAKVVLSEQGP